MASFEQRELKSEILFRKLWCGSGNDGDGMVKVKSNGKIMQLLKKKVFFKMKSLKMVSLVTPIFLPFFLFFFIKISSWFLRSFFFFFSLNYNFATLTQLKHTGIGHELTELKFVWSEGFK